MSGEGEGIGHTGALSQLDLTEPGYAMPLELWVQAACKRLEIIEVTVPLIYLDESRSVGGPLDDPLTRLDYYHQVLDHSITTAKANATSGSRCAESVA